MEEVRPDCYRVAGIDGFCKALCGHTFDEMGG